MSPLLFTHAFAAISALALCIALAPRAKHSPLLRAMLWTGLSLALWNVAQGLSIATHTPTWRILAPASASLPLAAFLRLALQAGLAKHPWRRNIEIAGLTLALAFSVLVLSALFWQGARGFVLSPLWNLAWSALAVPFLLLSFGALVYGSGFGSPSRRPLCAVLLAAGIFGFAGGLSAVLPPQQPLEFGAAGTLIGVILAAIAVTGRWRSRKNIATQELLSSLGVVVTIALAANYAVYKTAAQPILTASLIALIGIGAFAAYRQARKHWSQRLEESARLAALGQASGVLAHEVRNPLTTVQGALDLLESLDPSTTSEDRQRYLSMAKEELQRVLALVNDSLTYARSPDPEYEDFDLIRLVEHVLKHAQLRFSEAEIQGPGQMDPVPMIGDTGQLTRMLENLVVNACQSGDRPRVRVDFIERADFVILTVDDAGPGVPTELQQKIFEPFFTTKTRGGGLGLAIVREIARRHGGDISLHKSHLGGACFKISLQKKPDQETKDPA